MELLRNGCLHNLEAKAVCVLRVETDAVIADRNRMMLDAPCENDAHRAGIAARKRMLQGICYQFTNDHCNTARSLLQQ